MPGAYGSVKQCGEASHHLTAPCQQSRLCAEAHRGIVVKAPGVISNLKLVDFVEKEMNIIMKFIKNIWSNKIYILVTLIFIISLIYGLFTQNQYIKNIARWISSISVLSFFLKFTVDEIKQVIAFSYEKKKIAYDISMNSRFAYDIQVEYLEFCKKYVNKLNEIIRNVIKDGATPKCLDYSKELLQLRNDNTIIIPDEVHKELYDFEYSLRRLGAGKRFQNNVLGDNTQEEERIKSIRKTSKLLLHLTDKDNTDADRNIKNKEEIIKEIRNSLGINKIYNLKNEILS